MRTNILLNVTLLIFLLSGSICQSEELLCQTDLGTLGGTNSLANGINDAGQIVGWAHTGGDVPHAFLYQNGEMKDLGTLGDGSKSFAYAINGVGLIVGGSDTTDDLLYHAVRWQQNGDMVDLGTLGGSNSEAFGINDAGQIVGAADTLGGESHAVLWQQNGDKVDLDTLGSGTVSVALSINRAGQIVGWSDIAPKPDDKDKPPPDSHAFLYQGEEMVDLGTLDGIGDSAALWINDAGQIVGVSDTLDGESHAVLWQQNGEMVDMVDLGTLGGNSSKANAINNTGQIVGGSDTPGGLFHAYRRQTNGEMLDLGTLGDGSESEAFGINDAGQIVGVSNITPDVEGAFHAFATSRCSKGLPGVMLLLD
jgi:probable HAF family extracellular repeat protein